MGKCNVGWVILFPLPPQIPLNLLMFCSCDVKLPKVCVVKAMVVIDVCVYRESTWITGNEHPSSPKRCSVESLKVFLVNKTNQYPKPTLARVQEPYFWGCCGLSMLTGCQSVMLCGCYWTMLNSWSPPCCGLLGSTIFEWFPEPHGPNRQGWRIDDSSDESVKLDHDMGMTTQHRRPSESLGLRHDCSYVGMACVGIDL